MAVEVQLKRKQLYRDIDTSSCFFYNTKIDGKTVGVDLKVIDDVESILRSLKNIFSYEKGDLFFGDYEIAANIKRYLFEPMDFVTEISIRNDIKYAVEVYEPRVTIQEVYVRMGEDTEDNEKHKLEVTLVFTINNLNKTITTTFDIERIR